MAFEKFAGGMRKLREQAVLPGDAVTILVGGGVGHSRAGGESVGGVVWNVGDEERNLLRGKRGLREASAFDRGKMFADGIDFGDGRAGVNESTIGRDEIIERDFVVDGLLDDGGSAAADHKDHERGGGLRVEGLANCLSRMDGFGIGGGMAAAKITKAANLSRGFDRTGDNALE